MSERSRLQELRLIAELQRDKALAPVAAAKAELARIEATRAALRTQIVALSRDGSDLGYAGYGARNTVRLRAALAATAAELARHAADLERVRHEARRATARVDVLDTLQARAAKVAKQRAGRTVGQAVFRRPDG